ncbi:aminoglycoside phosphotransferase [Yinghuangia sp. ASG 101]|uniref:aminoglycoside phosphotransferase n=1 Tax=Yinghuangia sp. ASG 101 TaxID=2896848 RepID=UPI001E599E75|nr:aminoglycoside phosphotransferase [Yinghuangia sp. ASG 101]UGQ13707.1 aminoglycoside phosphotransferase [Yinghuangia sp. ASG 101]
MGVRDHTAGRNSHVSARLATEAGAVFIKGLRSDHAQAWTQLREAELNAHLGGVAPQLRWRLESGGWDLLCFEAVDGRHADYQPGSGDLPLVVDLLTRLAGVTAPGLEMRDAAQRLAGYVDDPADVRHFQGNALLHTDWNNTNILVTADRGTRMVDWGWATHGAAWLDAAYWVIWLIAFGHAPHEAEELAAKVPAWSDANVRALAVFSTANARLWSEIARQSPARWARAMGEASAVWAAYRNAVQNS